MSRNRDPFYEEIYELNTILDGRRTAETDDRCRKLYDVRKRWERTSAGSSSSGRSSSLKAFSPFLPPLVDNTGKVKITQDHRAIASSDNHDDSIDRDRRSGAENVISEKEYEKLNDDIDHLAGSLMRKENLQGRVNNAIKRVRNSVNELRAIQDVPYTTVDNKCSKKSVYMHLPPPGAQKKRHQREWETKQLLCGQKAIDRISNEMDMHAAGTEPFVQHESSLQPEYDYMQAFEQDQLCQKMFEKKVKLNLNQKEKPDRNRSRRMGEFEQDSCSGRSVTEERKYEETVWTSGSSPPPNNPTKANINVCYEQPQSFPAPPPSHGNAVSDSYSKKIRKLKPCLDTVDDKVHAYTEVVTGKNERLSLNVKVPTVLSEHDNELLQQSNWNETNAGTKKNKKHKKSRRRAKEQAQVDDFVVEEVNDYTIPHPPLVPRPSKFTRLAHGNIPDSTDILNEQRPSQEGWTHHNIVQPDSSIVPHPPSIPREDSMSRPVKKKAHRQKAKTSDEELAMAGHKKNSESSVVHHPTLISQDIDPLEVIVKERGGTGLAYEVNSRSFRRAVKMELPNIHDQVRQGSGTVPYPPIENKYSQDETRSPNVQSNITADLFVKEGRSKLSHEIDSTNTHGYLNTPEKPAQLDATSVVVPHPPPMARKVIGWTNEIAHRGAGFKSKQRREAELALAAKTEEGNAAPSRQNKASSEIRNKWKKETILN